MDKSNVTIRFEGQSHVIDANTLVNTLIHCKSLIDIINAECGGGREVRMNVNAIERGSFVIDVSLVGNVLDSLFSHDGMDYIANVVTVFEMVYLLFGFGHGRRIHDDEKENAVRHINVNMNTNNMQLIDQSINIYNFSVGAREAVCKTFETANDDGYVDGVTFGCGGGTVSFSRDEFPEIISNMAGSDLLPDDIEEERDVTLNVVGLRFEPGGKWWFFYDGRKISATVGAEKLMEAIDGGERFGKGDALRVRMRIVRRYSKEYNCYADVSYRITEYYEHIKAGRTGDLFRKA